MASDFTYDGEQNNQYVFRDKMSGTVFYLSAYQAGVAPELLDGDEVAIPNPNDSSELLVFSIREQRQVGRKFR